MFTNCYKLRFRRVTAIESPFQCFLHIKMPGRCSAPRCTNSNKEGFCLTTFTQDPKLRQQWIDAAGIPDSNPSKSAVLCEVTKERNREENFLQIYKAMQVKLKNVVQESEVLRGRVHCLQDDLMHIKSFGSHI